MEFMDKELGLYIHIPFCRSKCHYCDFNSFPGKEELVSAYFEALKKEIRSYSGRLKGYSVTTVFFGGGTPSLVESEYITGVLSTCLEHFNIVGNAETTIEANPGTLTREKLAAYKISGINRLSIGLQASQDRLLKRLGRAHSFEEFAESYELARKAGFENINVDLIFGIPGQTLGEWEDTLEYIAGLGPEHVSCYSLKIEEDTPFGRWAGTGKLMPVDDETDREMYRLAIEMMGCCGYNHYEISNFARKGFECRHNIIYWKAREYIGLGAGAHSYFEGKRFNNLCSLEDYIKTINEGFTPVENVYEVRKVEAASEFMMLGLRLVEGVDVSEFKRRFGQDVFEVFGMQISRLEKRGLLQVVDGKIRLSRRGLDLANQVFVEFI